MIVYWSMILWVPLIFFFYDMNHKEERMLVDYNFKQGIYNKVPMIFAIVTFAYFIFWIGMRTYVADTPVYINSFNSLPTDFATGWQNIDWDGKRPGFDIIALFFKCFITQDAQWWIMAIAIQSGVCVMLVIRKYSIDFFFSSFLFITLLTYTWLMNGMRQFICVSILFLCCDWIKDGKMVRFMIAVLILSTIHFTALLMIPIYFVARLKPWSGKIGLFIVGIAIICVFAEPLFNGMDTMLSNTAYAGQTAQFSEDDGVSPVRVGFYMIPTILAFWKRKEVAEYSKVNKMLPICVNMSLIAAALYFVGMFTSGILIGRMPVYADIYNLLLIPYLLHICFDSEQRKIVQKVYIIILLLFYFYMQLQGYYCSDITGYIT